MLDSLKCCFGVIYGLRKLYYLLLLALCSQAGLVEVTKVIAKVTAQDRGGVQPALALGDRFQLDCLVFSTPLIPLSVMLDISFLKRQFMKSSLVPGMPITDIWRAKFPAAKCHVHEKRKCC